MVPTTVTWIPDTRPQRDDPDPNEATRLDIELTAKFRQLVDLAETDPHLPGRLREAVAELKGLAADRLAELEEVKCDLSAALVDASEAEADASTAWGQVRDLEAEVARLRAAAT